MTPAAYLGPRFTVREHHGRILVSGEFDIAVRYVLAWFAEADADVELDLAGVTFIDSGGLVTLLQLQADLRDRSRTLHLVRPSVPVRRLLGVTGLSENFTYDAGSAIIPSSTAYVTATAHGSTP
jgi:anti-anti-sigma factor